LLVLVFGLIPPEEITQMPNFCKVGKVIFGLYLISIFNKYSYGTEGGYTLCG